MQSKEQIAAFEARKSMILDVLAYVGPMTRLELEHLLKLDDNAVNSALRSLRNQGKARIVRYERPEHNGNFAPVYAEGGGKDAPKPKPLTREEVCKRYNERNAFVISARRYADYHRSMGPWAGLMR